VDMEEAVAVVVVVEEVGVDMLVLDMDKVEEVVGMVVVVEDMVEGMVVDKVVVEVDNLCLYRLS